MQTAKYHTFIFDLDGTLLYTLADLAAAVNYALRTHQMPERTLDEVRNFVGNGVRMLMIRAIPDGLQNPQFDEVFSTFRSYYMQHSILPLLSSQVFCSGGKWFPSSSANMDIIA